MYTYTKRNADYWGISAHEEVGSLLLITSRKRQQVLLTMYKEWRPCCIGQVMSRHVGKQSSNALPRVKHYDEHRLQMKGAGQVIIGELNIPLSRVGG
jgi:hypothetical protein